jgi:hypothetical protein
MKGYTGSGRIPMDKKRTSPRPLSAIIPDEAIEHARKASEEIRKTVAAFLPALPPEFTTHRLAARKEMLLAVRSLIDNAIDRTEHEAKTEVKAAE